MDKVEFVKEILKILRYTDDADNVIRNLDAKTIVERMAKENGKKLAYIIPIQEGATNGDLVKAPFLNYCEDLKTIIEEDDDGKENEVHLVHVVGSEAINRYNENWWNEKYEIGGWKL